MNQFYKVIALTFLTSLMFASTSTWANHSKVDNGGEDDLKKVVIASRIAQTIKMDGLLNEQAWDVANVADQFTQLEPKPGIPSENATEVRVIYDDVAIYIGAVMNVTHKDEISKQFFERDQLNDQIETDVFGVALDTYMDGINGNGFMVGASGGQMDVKFSSDGDDESWDAVWQSAVTIHDKSWVVEMKIPYSALRFPDQNVQNWHIQFFRKTFNLNEEAFWSEIDPQVNGFFNQAGVLQGIKDIKSPVRLAATPFIAFNMEAQHDEANSPATNWSRSFSGGMDIRYGINDAFTLDMTLVPDFGQVRSDNQVLNLSPFEVRFDENRQFFTEGTELFGKANLFYSRRIGGRPLLQGDVEDQLGVGETIKTNPSRVQLINATKVSGRTNKGTGLGFFNAVADESYATITTMEGAERVIKTNPLTNYNIMVVDQNLPNNSYVSLINTNVMREGSIYDANVTGTEFQVRTKDNAYYIGGNGAISQIFNPDETDVGHKYNIEIGKRSGNINFEVGTNVESDRWNPNDLGLVFNNNERNYRGWIGYNKYEAFGPFLRMNAGVFGRISYLFANPDKEIPMLRKNLYTESGMNVWWNATTRNFYRFNVSTYFQPTESFNYFEPRTAGRYYTFPAFANFRTNFETDNRKKLSTEISMRFLTAAQEKRNRFQIELEPTYRISDRFALAYSLEYTRAQKEEGFVSDFENEIIFGRRDRHTTENLLSANYSFSSNANINFRMRHNWTQVRYESFHNLEQDGSLTSSNYNENEDLNFNAFTIDMVYRWRFAPGSDIFITYKNAVFGLDEMSKIGFSENVSQLFENPVSNSLAIKVLYYLDYLDVKNVFKKKV